MLTAIRISNVFVTVSYIFFLINPPKDNMLPFNSVD